MQSLELIPLRTIDSLNWDEINNPNKFPDIFREFNTTYSISELFASDKNFYLDNDQKKSLGMFQFTLKPSIIVDTFFDPSEITTKLELLMDLEDDREGEILSNGYLPFAYCASGQLLMVSTNVHPEPDGIYLYTQWNDDPLERIAHNIFHFFRNFELKTDHGIVSESTLKSLYRNWGEDFWRLTENKG